MYENTILRPAGTASNTEIQEKGIICGIHEGWQCRQHGNLRAIQRKKARQERYHNQEPDTINTTRRLSHLTLRATSP